MCPTCAEVGAEGRVPMCEPCSLTQPLAVCAGMAMALMTVPRGIHRHDRFDPAREHWRGTQRACAARRNVATPLTLPQTSPVHLGLPGRVQQATIRSSARIPRACSAQSRAEIFARAAPSSPATHRSLGRRCHLSPSATGHGPPVALSCRLACDANELSRRYRA